MRVVVMIVVLLTVSACKTTGHKCDAYESRPVTKKK